MFPGCLPFPKVSAQKIYYCEQKPAEIDKASMVSSKVSHDLKGRYQTQIPILPTFFFEPPSFHKKLDTELKFWKLK